MRLLYHGCPFIPFCLRFCLDLFGLGLAGKAGNITSLQKDGAEPVF
jgi:hypothetical protein